MVLHKYGLQKIIHNSKSVRDIGIWVHVYMWMDTQLKSKEMGTKNIHKTQKNQIHHRINYWVKH